MMKHLLDEFEADWAAMPGLEKNQLNQLKHTTIAVSGQTLARCFCYALFYQNDALQLDMQIIYIGNDMSVFGDRASYVQSREDFRFVDFSSLSELNEVNYVIHTGLCNEAVGNFSAELVKETQTAHALTALAVHCNAKLLLLSDSRVYGEAKPGRVYAENEYAALPHLDSCYFDAQLLRAVECLYHCEEKMQLSSPMLTLRTGEILGAHSGFVSALEDAFRCAANGTEGVIADSGRKISFVYLTDVLHAMIFLMINANAAGTYNVCGDGMTLSTGMAAAVLHDLYGACVSLGAYRTLRGCAVSDGKLRMAGFTPTVNIQTAFALCVMAHQENVQDFVLPNTHDGRLKAIQRIQLSYLLEVDRICRKHQIRYFLGGGTLLGAIRHKGFIPWDDDADIMMLREDYDAFLKIAEQELPQGMTLETHKTNKHCYYEFAKLRIDGTVFATDFASGHQNTHNGIAFDIFCHDKTANSALGRKLHMAMTIFTRALVLNKWNHRKVDNGSRLQSAVTNFFVKVLPLGLSYRLMNTTIRFFKGKKNAKYLYDGMGRNVYNGCFPIELLSEVMYTDFEGYPLPVPKRYDEYLRFLYGDYTEPAPLSTRLGCHEILLCDIGKYDY